MLKSKTKVKIKDWIKAIIIAVLIIWFVNTFLIKSLSVNTSNMENTLYRGDHIIINKIIFGIRLPITLLSIPLTSDKIPFTEINSYLDWISLPYFRLLRFFKVKRNDLLVINNAYEDDLPVDKKSISVKRCIALPGDTILILNKKVFVNDKMIKFNDNIIYKYRIITNGNDIPKEIIDKFDLHSGGIVSEGVYDYCISPSTSDSLLTYPFIKNVKLLRIYKSDESYFFFPQNPSFGWNDDFFGPIIVPVKDSLIKLNKKNIDLYKRIIEKYENNILSINGDTILINNKITKEYKFKMNYYFVMDDNRDNSYDSREWGFLPENHIIGSASFVWFSIDKSVNAKKNIRWNRFFKILN